jgi:hypothetical protein
MGCGIPVVHCPAGERKHEVPEEYLAKTNIAQGVFPDSGGPRQGAGVGRQRQPSHRTKKPMPYVDHYSFISLNFAEIVKLEVGNGFVTSEYTNLLNTYSRIRRIHFWLFSAISFGAEQTKRNNENKDSSELDCGAVCHGFI